MAKVLIEVEYDSHDESVTPERIVGYFGQLITEDAESRDYEEQHGYLDRDDRAFTIGTIRRVVVPK
jgi:hypothetical protein